MKRRIPSFFFRMLLMIMFSALLTIDGLSMTEQQKPTPRGITPRRAAALVGVAIGLTSLIVSLRARKRAANTRPGARPMIITGLVLGSVAVLYSVVHLVNIPGGFGTGGGKAGAVIGLVLGFSGVLVSGLALSRSKKAR